MKTFSLDISNKTNIPVLYVKQKDVGKKIFVKITDSGIPFEIPTDASFSVWFSGASGEGNYKEIDGRSAFAVAGNSVVVELIHQMVNNSGEHTMCIVLTNGVEEQIGFWNIPYYVEELPGANSEEAKKYYDDLATAAERAENAAERAENAAENVEDVKPKDIYVTATFGDSNEHGSSYGSASISSYEIYEHKESGATVYLRDEYGYRYELDAANSQSGMERSFFNAITVYGNKVENRSIVVKADRSATRSIYEFSIDLTSVPAVLYEEQSLDEEQQAQAKSNLGLSVVEPLEDDIPKVFFGGELPQTKDETVMPFRYISKTKDIICYCKTKAQGDSSMDYPKKNQTVKLYKDAECTEKLKVDFKGWGKQNKFCFKANWTDISHARNVVTARLWGDVVKSRNNYTEIPELLRTSPNQGAVDGFPVKVYANGVYQGRYTLNIPKDDWMANMDDSLDEHCILYGESGNSPLFMATPVIDGTDWTDEVHDVVPESIKSRWIETIGFVMNSTDADFKSNLGNYFDIESLIDYYLFGMAICHVDGFKGNQVYMTYDGQKWYASAYDMDCTWGLVWKDEIYVEYNYVINVITNNRLYNRLTSLFNAEIKARWAQLRVGALSIENIINRFERFTDISPDSLVAEDYAETTANGAFTGIPKKTTNNIQQIRKFAFDRLAWVDEQIL